MTAQRLAALRTEREALLDALLDCERRAALLRHRLENVEREMLGCSDDESDARGPRWLQWLRW